MPMTIGLGGRGHEPLAVDPACHAGASHWHGSRDAMLFQLSHRLGLLGVCSALVHAARRRCVIVA